MHEPSDILQIGKGSKMSGPIQMLISTPFDVIKVFFQVFNERIFFWVVHFLTKEGTTHKSKPSFLVQKLNFKLKKLFEPNLKDYFQSKIGVKVESNLSYNESKWSKFCIKISKIWYKSESKYVKSDT